MGAGQHSGFVVIHRQIFDSGLWRQFSPADFKVAIACIVFANWKSGEWHTSSGIIEIERGQFVTSTQKLADDLKLTRKTVRGSLQRLSRAEFLKLGTNTGQKFTIITVLNYCLYQDQSDNADQTTGHSRATHGPLTGHSRATIEQENKGTREQGNKEQPPKPPKGDVEIVVEYLNGQLGRTGAACFRARGKTRELIEARLADGALVRDLRMVCWHRVREWKDDEQMAKFLRPSTLFRRSKFEEYLPQAAAAVAEQGQGPTDPHKVSREDYKPLLGGLR